MVPVLQVIWQQAVPSYVSARADTTLGIVVFGYSQAANELSPDVEGLWGNILNVEKGAHGTIDISCYENITICPRMCVCPSFLVLP